MSEWGTKTKMTDGAIECLESTSDNLIHTHVWKLNGSNSYKNTVMQVQFINTKTANKSFSNTVVMAFIAMMMRHQSSTDVKTSLYHCCHHSSTCDEETKSNNKE